MIQRPQSLKVRQNSAVFHVIGGACVLFSLGLGYYLYQQSQQAVLSSNLSLQQSIAVTKHLLKRNIPFHVRRQGREILVPRKKLARLKQELKPEFLL